MNRPRAGLKDILQSAVGTARIEHAIGIEGQLMTEIIGHILIIARLDKQVMVALRLWVLMGDFGNHIDATACLETLAGTGQYFLVLCDGHGTSGACRCGPLGGDAMQVIAFGEETAVHGLWRDKDAGDIVMIKEGLQSADVVGMTV